MKPSIKLDITKIATKKYVTLLSPFSVDCCDENNWLAAPIEAMPSPLGECKRTKMTLKTPDIICKL